MAEPAASAVLHGRVPGRDFELRLSRDRAVGVVRVEVSDTHPGQLEPRRPGSDPADGDGGRGLLVAAVAARWGVTGRTGPGKTVWAECVTDAG